MAKILSQQEFENLSIDELTTLLKSKCNITVPKNTSKFIVLDLAKNRLHGTHFILDDEEIIKDKIVKKPIIINKNFEKCPTCKQKSLILQPFPASTGLQGSKYCTNCGYLEKPKEQTTKKTKTKETKQTEVTNQ